LSSFQDPTRPRESWRAKKTGRPCLKKVKFVVENTQDEHDRAEEVASSEPVGAVSDPEFKDAFQVTFFVFWGGEGVSNKGALVSLGPRGIIHRVTFAHPRWLRQGTAANPPGGEDRSVGEVPWEQAFLSVSLFKNKEINVFRIRNPLAPCRRR